jgi:hypothetical protein
MAEEIVAFSGLIDTMQSARFSDFLDPVGSPLCCLSDSR